MYINRAQNEIIDCIASECSIYRICDKVFGILEKQCIPTVLEFFFKEVDSLNSTRYQPNEEEQRLIRAQIEKYGKVWGEIINSLLCERLESELFYEKLWNSICNTPLFESREAKVCILYLTCMNMCIPYYAFHSDMQMGGSRYVEYANELKDEIVKARSMIFQPCRQQTERADVLLNMLEQWEDREKKAVFLTQVIHLFELKAKLRNELPDT